MRKMSPVLIAFLLIGCESDAPAPPRTEQVQAVDPANPCSLLSGQDIGGAVGSEVDKGREVESRPNSEGESIPLCLYRTGSPYASVTIHVESPVTEPEFRRRSTRDARNTKHLTDVADLAYIHAGVSLSLLMDDAAITATVQHFDSVDNTEEVLRKIGIAAVHRLQT